MEIPEMMSWIGSLIAMVAFLRGIIPREYTDHITDRLQDIVSPYSYFVVPEYEGNNANELYAAVQTYLSSLTRQRARMSNMWMEKNAKGATFSMAKNQRIRDTFEKVRVEWMHHMEERRNTLWMGWDGSTDERRYFKIKMPRQHKDLILDTYVSYILKEAKELQRSNRELNLYSNRKGDRGRKGGWNSIPFKHPASFDTIALDPEQKLSILNDLDSFVHGEEFYRRVGKSWKRGYLLFGPPGTGKTSIIAAIANHLRYDVYDLELTEVQSNADLRKLLLHTSNKSIVVIEDIDCSLDLSGQRKKKKSTPNEEDGAAPPLPTKLDDEDKSSKVTLSGLLNFTDGLWSCCGSERIFVFTTNFLHKLDPALLRPGRMDMHINLSYCRYQAFKILAKNFLQINEHPRFSDVEQIIDSSFMSPAEIAEILTKDRTNPDLALDILVKALHDSKNKPPPPLPNEEDDADNSVESGAVSSEKKTTEENTTE